MAADLQVCRLPLHIIRLRGPWQIEALAQFRVGEQGQSAEVTTGLPAGAETEVPGDWAEALGSEFRGRVRYVRRFGLPTNLGADEKVSLVIGAIDEQGSLELNGTPLGEQSLQAGEQRYDVTRLLNLRNELRIVVTAQHSVGGLRGEVRLEIEEARAS